MITRCKYFNPTFLCTFMTPFSLKHVSCLTLCSLFNCHHWRLPKKINLIKISKRKSPRHIFCHLARYCCFYNKIVTAVTFSFYFRNKYFQRCSILCSLSLTLKRSMTRILDLCSEFTESHSFKYFWWKRIFVLVSLEKTGLKYAVCLE